MSSSLTGPTILSKMTSRLVRSFCYTNSMRWAKLTEKIHISWLIAAFCFGLVIGVVAVYNLPSGDFSSIFWPLIGLTIFVVVAVKRWRVMIVLAILAGGAIGLCRGDIGRTGMEKYQQLFGKNLTIQGSVSEDPDVDKKQQTVLRVGNAKLINGDQAVSLPGQIWVTTGATDVVKRSDIVTVQGKISQGFGAFQASLYRAKLKKVERPVPGDVAVGVRDWFAGRVRQNIPEPESALGLGFLLGLRRALPQDLNDDLKIAGLTHVIVASGYNLTILVRLSRRLFAKSSKYLALISSVAMTFGFMSLTGMSPSMSRAGLVTILSLLTWYYGRKVHPFVLLPLAAAITLIINPQFGWNDLGWQLSFLSFIGVIVLAPLLQKFFFGNKPPGTLRQIIGETLSAQIMTLPVLIAAFGAVSNVSLIANVLILPFVPLAMLLVFVSGILVSVPLIGWVVAIPTTWLLSYMIMVAKWVADLPWAQTEISFNVIQVVLSYAVIIVAIWLMARATKFNFREANIVE